MPNQSTATEPVSASPERDGLPAHVGADGPVEATDVAPEAALAQPLGAEAGAQSGETPEAAASVMPATPPTEQAPAVPELSPAACAAKLGELFPAVFTPHSPKPLKLRIQADLQQRAPGVFTRKVLSAFLHRHTTSTAYLKALAHSPHRFDLDGAPAGDVADEHRDAALAELQRRRSLHDERRAAEREAQRAAERAAQQEARRTQVAQDEARRELLGLLRAYESSTLTKQNFCALKGLSEAELEARLAEARKLPAPPAPQAWHGDERADRRGDRRSDMRAGAPKGAPADAHAEPRRGPRGDARGGPRTGSPPHAPARFPRREETAPGPANTQRRRP